MRAGRPSRPLTATNTLRKLKALHKRSSLDVQHSDQVGEEAAATRADALSAARCCRCTRRVAATS